MFMVFLANILIFSVKRVHKMINKVHLNDTSSLHRTQFSIGIILVFRNTWIIFKFAVGLMETLADSEFSLLSMRYIMKTIDRK